MTETVDQAAIRELLLRERAKVRAGDFDGYATGFAQADYVGRWHASSISGIFAFQGWEEIARRLQISPRERNGHPSKEPGVMENLRIRVSGDMAWLTHIVRYPNTPTHRASPEPAHHLRILERQNAEWKVVFYAYLDPGLTNPRSSRIRVDPEGRVLWMDAGVEQRIAADDDLVIRSGKLRIRDTRANKKFLAATNWAATLDHGMAPEHGALPIVLERGEDLPTRIWWVFGDGGGIYFSLGDTERDAQRLNQAAMAFGLSGAQRQVAGYIVDGLAMPEIAISMKVRPSTVRTHVLRMFDKLGVRNRAALVRMLLSVAAPL